MDSLPVNISEEFSQYQDKLTELKSQLEHTTNPATVPVAYELVNAINRWLQERSALGDVETASDQAVFSMSSRYTNIVEVSTYVLSDNLVALRQMGGLLNGI